MRLGLKKRWTFFHFFGGPFSTWMEMAHGGHVSTLNSSSSCKKMGKKKAYVVFQLHPGYRTGVYESWPEAKAATSGLTGSPQGFKSVEEAERAFSTGELAQPKKFYVVGGSSQIYHVYDRAVQAAEELGRGKDKVYKVKTLSEAEAYVRNNYARRRQLGIVPPPPQQERQEGGVAAQELEEEELDLGVDPPRQLTGNAANRVGRTIVFDTETTGLDSSKDQIVQFSMSIYDDGSLVHSESFLIRPSTDVEMSPGAQRVHGITMERLQGEPTF